MPSLILFWSWHEAQVGMLRIGAPRATMRGESVAGLGVCPRYQPLMANKSHASIGFALLVAMQIQKYVRFPRPCGHRTQPEARNHPMRAVGNNVVNIAQWSKLLRRPFRRVRNFNCWNSGRAVSAVARLAWEGAPLGPGGAPSFSSPENLLLMSPLFQTLAACLG